MNTHIYQDLKTIKESLGANFSSIHLFGSYAKGMYNPSDIDIMIRVKKKKDSVEILQKLKNLNLSIGNVVYCDYDSPHKVSKDNYDIVIVPDDNVNCYFFQRNKNDFIKILE